MKTKATLFNLSVVLSLVLAVTAIPVASRTNEPIRAVASTVVAQTNGRAIDDVPDRLKMPTKQPGDRRTGNASGQTLRGPFIIEVPAGSFDQDLRTLPTVTFDPGKVGSERPAPREMPDLKKTIVAGFSADPYAQMTQGRSNMPMPIADFPGMTGAESGYIPPDTVGDVGPNHYIQYVNAPFSIYNKACTRLVGPVLLSTFFNASQAPCDTRDDGDVIALYDSMADRWILSQFALPNYPNGPFYECIAISKTGNPVTGGWWTYAFPASTPDIDGDNMAMNDYPKLSVWPDAYYMTANMYPVQNTPGYVRVWALNRSRMLAGQAIQSVSFDVFDAFTMLAGNLHGDAPPPGSPELLMAVRAPDKLNLWQFHVDWAHPERSTLTGPTSMTIPFYTAACNGARACVPQDGHAQRVDSVSPRLMFNNQYRRVGNTESLWVNHTITETGKTAIRWYEVRLTRGSNVITPTLYQQGTLNFGDNVWRWMGSIAADRMGNAALGYSASSTTFYPQIRYIGRLVTDTLNLMPQAEYTATVGGGAQTHAAARWGDYSAMSIDPVDDCTFWYTQEYYATTSSSNWSTRILSFKYPSCVPQPASGTITGTVYNSVTMQMIPNMPVVAVNAPLTRTASASTDVNGVFTMTVLPGTWTVTAGPLESNYPAANSAAPVAVTSGGTANVSIGLQPFPSLVEGNRVYTDPAPNGNGNGFVEPGESIRLAETISNTGLFTATNVTAQLIALTPGVTVVTSTATYGAIAAGAAATNATPFGFTVNGGVPCGTVLQFQKIVTSTQRVFTLSFSIKAEMPGGMCAYPVPKLNLANASFTEPSGNGIIEPGDTSINVFAALQNVGITNATSVSGMLVAQTPGITLSVSASAYPNIAIGAIQTNTTPFNFSVSPGYVCGVPAGFTLNTATARGDFSHNFSLPTGQGPVPANVFFDDVESGIGNWITGTTYSGWGWQITTEDAHSPTHSWTDSPGTDYAADASAWLESPVYNFSTFDAVTLSFWHKYRTEPGYDYGFVEVSTDGGATWLAPVAAFDGAQLTWTQATISLAPLAHQANARFRFRLFSDESVVDDGWHIDDIRVTGMKRLCNPLTSDWQAMVYVNGVLTTTNPAIAKPGDTVQIVNRVYVTATNNVTFALTENWSAAFGLTGFSSTAGSVVTTANSLAWSGNNVAFNTWHTLTKTFNVLPGPTTGAITESLTVENGLPMWPDRVLNFTRTVVRIYLPLIRR